MSTAITLQSVTKQFTAGAAPALRGINLDILSGARTAILGPSGSGKSTILRMIAGLEDPSDGQILLNGRDVTGVLPERRGIGMVFQRPLLFPHLSVLDNIAFPLRAAGLSRRAAREAARPSLDLVQLPGFDRRSVSSLSGGQQQRVAIARTLAAKPTILLLDEPFSALDPALRDDMHALLTRLRTELPPTVVIVTHDRDEAAAVADHIAVERIYHRPTSLAVARLMGGRNEIAGTVQGARHHSDLGAIAVDAGTPDGPGTLVVRPEAVRIIASPRDAQPGDHPHTATVQGVTRTGIRRSLVMSAGSALVTADLPAGVEAPVGATVTFGFAPGAPSVVTA